MPFFPLGISEEEEHSLLSSGQTKCPPFIPSLGGEEDAGKIPLPLLPLQAFRQV